MQGDRFEVIGESYVVIYDNQSTLDSGGLFYFLAPGDQYDLATRQAYRPVPGPRTAGPRRSAPLATAASRSVDPSFRRLIARRAR